jgi:hypothetical protein
VDVGRAIVDTRPNCGNMLAGVGPFAIEAGLVPAQPGETLVRILNVNTGTRVDSLVQTPGGAVTYEGAAEIPGVAGTAAPIMLRFRDVAGSQTGTLFPSGHQQEEIGGIAVTLIDGAMPMMLLRARDLGADITATPDALNADRALFARVEGLRREAGLRMRLGDVADSVVPKPCLLGAGTDGRAQAHDLHRPVHAALVDGRELGGQLGHPLGHRQHLGLELLEREGSRGPALLGGLTAAQRVAGEHVGFGVVVVVVALGARGLRDTAPIPAYVHGFDIAYYRFVGGCRVDFHPNAFQVGRRRRFEGVT